MSEIWDMGFQLRLTLILNRIRRRSRSTRKVRATPSGHRRLGYLPELIRFLIDRTGYIKALETEGSPEAFSRIEI